MKNQYFGDINDYRKYGLLRCFADADFSVGVCWMLTPDGPTNQGQRTRYLSEPERWRHFDPQLFDLLHASVMSGKRAVAEIEESRLIKNARYWSAPLDHQVAERSAYLEAAREALKGCDLWFFDPDVGLEVKSVKFGSARSPSYLYWGEVESVWRAGASILVFQHFPRENREGFVAKVSSELRERTRHSLVSTFHTSHVVFLFAGQPAHAGRFAAAARCVVTRWKGQVREQAPKGGEPLRGTKKLVSNRTDAVGATSRGAPVATKPRLVTADDLGRWRRGLLRLLDQLDARANAELGPGARVSRLARTDVIPRRIAAFMRVVLESRNAAEYEAHEPSAIEGEAVRRSWMAVCEWAESEGFKCEP